VGHVVTIRFERFTVFIPPPLVEVMILSSMRAQNICGKKGAPTTSWGLLPPTKSSLCASLIHFKGAVAFARYVSNNDNFKKLNFSRKIAVNITCEVIG